MSLALEPMGLERESPLPPRRLAVLMRPELETLIAEIVGEIRRQVPEYARPVDGPYGRMMRMVVEHTLAALIERIANPSSPRVRPDEACRALGRAEAREGRTLDPLHLALGVGVNVLWARMVKLAVRHDLSATVIGRLAQAIFRYQDEVTKLCLDGYLDAKSKSTRAQIEYRRQLLRLILEGPAVSPRAIDKQASLARWIVPDEVTLVAIEGRIVPSRLDPDVLVELDPAQPHLLVPGCLTGARRAKLGVALCDATAAIGLSLPLSDASDSLRWARRALRLLNEGIIKDGPITLCDDHLLELWMFADVDLISQLAKQKFSPLIGKTGKQRRRIVESIRAWLDAWGNANEMARLLAIHPQTVRYRMKMLERTLGRRMSEPMDRLTLDLLIRAHAFMGREILPEAATDDQS